MPLDDVILEAIFQPTQQALFSLAETEAGLESALEATDLSPELPALTDIDPLALAREHEAVALSEAGQHEAALAVLDALILKHPNHIAAYNNRCQVLRSLGRYDEALRDIDHCLHAKPPKAVARQAHLQRGILHRFELSDASSTTLGDTPEAATSTGLADFQAAAALGHPLAKQLLVTLNPYAAMCNAVVADLMRQLKTPPKV